MDTAIADMIGDSRIDDASVLPPCTLYGNRSLVARPLVVAHATTNSSVHS
jgi:hypothetical protein